MKLFKVVLVFFVFYLIKRFFQLVKVVNELKAQQNVPKKNADIVDAEYKVLQK